MYNSELNRKLILVGIFSLAMGFLETAVVVYLREIYYPDGFQFPLVAMSQQILSAELLRELATLIMLVCIGWLSGRTFNSRFAWFLYSFAIWDIFYYLFLKLLLNWPESLFTTDILFLIPLLWVGPVLAPVIISLSMILLAVLILKVEEKTGSIRMKKLHWFLFITGSLVLLLSFMLDYFFFIQQLPINELKETDPFNQLMVQNSTYMPGPFKWWLFSLGQSIIFVGIYLLWKSQKKRYNAYIWEHLNCF
ncbi:MAG: hypothetical protein IPM71_12890 [Bacteroidota bacterium]|nr:MAG: hypothetical protein IPM71_12890 [Bacteroidota bacterium]